MSVEPSASQRSRSSRRSWKRLPKPTSASRFNSASADNAPTSSPGVSDEGSSDGRPDAHERSASHASTRTTHDATIVFASAFGPERPRTNGAAAISVQESSRPTTAAQASGPCNDSPSRTGTIENETLEADATRKPVQ